MEAESVNPTFEAMPFPVRSFGALGNAQYKVFASEEKSILVEAETAAEAFKVSGIDDPFRIERIIPGKDVVIDRARWKETEQATPQSASGAEPPAAETTAADAPSAADAPEGAAN